MSTTAPSQFKVMLALMLAPAWALAALTVGGGLWHVVTGNPWPGNPFTALIHIAQGWVHMSAGLWGCIGFAAVLLVGLAGLLWWMFFGMYRTPKRGDASARLVGDASDSEGIRHKAVAAKAKRLGVEADVAGLPIGKAVRDGAVLESSFEDVCLMVAGPRTGKTTSWVVPRIFAAPGAVVATSNKRDIADITRAQRAKVGRVWVFDPQGIADEPQTWWWDPLSYCTDAVQARAMADVFASATRDANAQTSAYFDNAAKDLIAGLLLAARVGGRSLGVVHGWLNNQEDDTPVRLLAEGGQSLMASTVQGVMDLVPETRSGVYGSASTIMAFLLNEKAMVWVTPHPMLEKFDPAAFVTRTDTLYLLSQEGRGSASPIVTALTVAVTEAALEEAKHHDGGRLELPMLIELDEAANVCRWKELPDMYSHFGSRGICVDTLLQSWSQGASAWGEAGIRKLWSASNVKVYGGGVSERGFLSELSDLIGVHYVDSKQVSSSRQGRSVSVSKASQQRPIATVADLQGLASGRAWVFSSGSLAVLAQLVPFWQERSGKE